MDHRRYGDTVYIRMDRGDEIVKGVLEVCEKEGISSAVFSGIGGCGEAQIQTFAAPPDGKRENGVLASARSPSVLDGVDAVHVVLVAVTLGCFPCEEGEGEADGVEQRRHLLAAGSHDAVVRCDDLLPRCLAYAFIEIIVRFVGKQVEDACVQIVRDAPAAGVVLSVADTDRALLTQEAFEATKAFVGLLAACCRYEDCQQDEC